MEENEMLDGFNSEYPNPEHTPETASVPGADTSYSTDAPAYPAPAYTAPEDGAPIDSTPYDGMSYDAAAPVDGGVVEENKKGKKEKKEKPPVDPAQRKLNRRKTAVLTTYFIALLCLVAGLVVPLFNWTSDLPVADKMMFKYIPDMFNHMFGKYLNIPIVSPFKAMPEGVSDFTCVIGILYAVITVVAIAMFIPILLSSIGKKNKTMGATAALIVEIIALLITASYVAYTTYSIISGNGTETIAAWRDYNFFIPLGGVLLMAIIQIVAKNKGLGVSKTIAVILSTIGVFALLDFATFIPQAGVFVGNLAAQFELSSGFIEGLELAPKNTGIDGLNIVLHITSFWNQIAASDWRMIIVYVLFMLVTIITLLNLVVDILGMTTGKLTRKETVYKTDEDKIEIGKKDKKHNAKSIGRTEIDWNNPASNAFAIVRYLIPILMMAAIFVIAIFWKEGNIDTGVYFGLLFIILVISLINAAIRTGVANAKRKKSEAARKEEFRARENNVNIAFAEQEGDTSSLYGGQQYVEPYAEPYPAGYYGAYAQPQQTPYDPYAAQQPVPEQQPAYEPYPVEQQPTYEPVPEQTSYAQEQQVEPQQPDYSPYYTDYTQDNFDPYASDPYGEPANDYSAPVYEEPVQVENPFDVSLDKEPEVPVESNYEGPTDSFMNTLTDDEKAEFLDVFVDKNKGSVKGIPDYVIGEDNDDFFPMVFVHINRYRNTVSDGLMSKMYRQLIK